MGIVGFINAQKYEIQVSRKRTFFLLQKTNHLPILNYRDLSKNRTSTTYQNEKKAERKREKEESARKKQKERTRKDRDKGSRERESGEKRRRVGEINSEKEKERV